MAFNQPYEELETSLEAGNRFRPRLLVDMASQIQMNLFISLYRLRFELGLLTFASEVWYLAWD